MQRNVGIILVCTSCVTLIKMFAFRDSSSERSCYYIETCEIIHAAGLFLYTVYWICLCIAIRVALTGYCRLYR